MEEIRVLIADDHGIVREGLRSLLENAGLQVVGEAANGQETLALVDRLQPQVVLLDIRMPDIDGLQVLARIKAAHPQVSVIMLTTYANPGYLARAVNLGAAGYLSKDINPDRIPVAVRAAARGDHLLDRDLLRTVLAGVSVPEPPVDPQEPASLPVEPLTEREVEVLRLIVNGLNNEAIAKTLSVSVPTVKTHVRHILEKLGVSDRTQAAVWAVRHGIG
ncbi:MAG: DNA-binding response regulator [Chloroflexi bacterium]|nr:MAG: DNA-binding response regulator [Chloroflexota bacterium]